LLTSFVITLYFIYKWRHGGDCICCTVGEGKVVPVINKVPCDKEVCEEWKHRKTCKGTVLEASSLPSKMVYFMCKENRLYRAMHYADRRP